MTPNKSDRTRAGADITRARVRGAAPTAEKKRRGLFLLMDVFLLIGILGVIFLLLLAFTPFSLLGDDAEPRQILYTVELSGVDQRFVTAFREGDAVVDADTGSAIGEIVQIKVRDYEADKGKQSGCCERLVAWKRNGLYAGFGRQVQYFRYIFSELGRKRGGLYFSFY